MKRNLLLALALAWTAAAFAAPDPGTIFRGASVTTAWDETPRRAAILVKDGIVVSIGNEAEARAAAPSARIVDLAGAALVPGLTDAHGHVRGLGALRRMIDCRGLSKDEIRLRVRALSASAAKGTWIRRRAWDHNRWTDTAFTRATPDPPGGRIERLKDGSPAGVLVDNAMNLVVKAIPEPVPDEIRKDLVAGLAA